jgi:hypothetical protein
MKWLALTVLAVLAMGCCCNPPGPQPVDPFARVYGRMTVPPPGTGSIAPQGAAPYYPGPPPGGPAPCPQTPNNPAYQYQGPPPGGPAPFQQAPQGPAPQGPSNPPYQYQAPPPGTPPQLQPIPQQPGAALPNPGGNWTNSRPGTSTSWTGQSPSGPGDVITIPVSEGAAPLGPAVGPAADGRGS